MNVFDRLDADRRAAELLCVLNVIRLPGVGGGRLAELHRHLDETLRWLAPAERSEKFTGHVTVGRFKPGHHAAIPKLLELAADFRTRHFGGWEAREVQIVRSELTSLRAEHVPLTSFSLVG